MAGNNSIQILRGSGHSSSAQLLPGQPYYDYFNNQLYIGGSVNTPINQAKAIGSANPVGSSIGKYWENVGARGAVNARLGECAFIETADGNILPALCVDSSISGGTTWQVSWHTKHNIATSSATLTWGGTELCTWLNSTVLNLLPDYLKNKITSVTKSSGGTDSGTSCKLWVPSAEEIWGKDNNTFPSSMAKDDNSTQFGYYKWLLEGDETSTESANYKLRSNCDSWLRNRYLSGTSSWYSLGGEGRLYLYLVHNADNVVFCFSIK